MRCAYPFQQGLIEYGCGQCMPCRLNRQRLWVARLMLEARMHDSSFFVTLTYDEEHVPCDMSVSLRDVQLWLKRLRSLMAPSKLRYYVVGEYGDVNQRPHYHAVLFGLQNPSLIEESWTAGMVHVGTLTVQSAAYVVSYVVKGMTGVADTRLTGRYPEFARMSLRPGIGALAVPVLRAAVLDEATGELRLVAGDVPGVLRTEGKLWPLGRYLRSKLRVSVGMDASESDASRVLRSVSVAVDGLSLGTKEFVRRRGLRREASVNKARSRFQIARSKKGIGV